MKLIDADALEVVGTVIPNGIDVKGYVEGMEYILNKIDSMPTIEPERKKGKWECDRLGTFICSCCGSGYKEQPTLMGRPMFEWCPMCGADMRGEQNAEH